MTARPHLIVLEDRTAPATFTVDTLSDVTAADGQTTLREAIALANVSPGPDTLVFAPALAGGTVALGGGGLSLGDGVTLTGFPDRPVTVAGGFAAGAAAADVLLVQAGVTATVAGLRLTNTTPGGHGLTNLGTLTLDRVTITGVTGGSGLRNAGTAAVTNCLIAGNTSGLAFDGGGVTNISGSLTIRDTRIENNRTTEPTVGAGGGLLVLGGRVDVANVSVTGNAASVGGGGVLVSGGVFTAAAGTRITGNTAPLGGGLAVVGLPPNNGVPRVPTVGLTGAVIDGNTAGSGGGVGVAAFSALYYPTVTLADTAVTNNTADTNSTATVVLGVTTGANPQTLAVPRGVGGGLAVAGGTVTVTGGTFAGNAATAGGGASVLLGTVDLSGTTVAGNTATTGAGASVVGSATGTPATTFTGVTFAGNLAAENQTGSLTYSVPGLPLPVLARGDGGGLYVAAGTATVTGGRFTGNRATTGGAAAAASGTLGLTRVTVSGNTATGRAGGVAVGGTVEFTASTADGNTAGAAGGGFGVTGGSLTLTNATVAGNRAAVGGGVAVEGGAAAVLNSTVAGNTATDAGGGVAVVGGSLTARSSILAANTAATARDVVGTVISSGGNVIGVADGATGFGGADRAGTGSAPLDPRLAPLADNGGPTRTRLPAADSPAIDHGSASAATATDQRGRPRVAATGIDAGAVERQADDPAVPRGLALPRTFAAGADAGGGPVVRSFTADGSERLSLTAFAAAFTGGVRVAEADVNGDGVADVIAGTGPGTRTLVKGFDGRTGAELFSVQPFEDQFTAGVYVAAGDLSGDGRAEVVVTPDQSGGPRVRVFTFDGSALTQLADFFGIDDPAFRGGARSAVGDLTGDGAGDLVVAAGFGGGPRVAVFDGRLVAAGNTGVKPVPDFFVFEDTLRNGAFVAAGDLDGDGRADLIAGGGPGGGPRVRAFSGADVLARPGTPADSLVSLANFFAGDPANRAGVRVAVKDLDGDARADLVAGAGTGAGSRVTAYAGRAVVGSDTPDSLFAFDAVPGFGGGVFVG